MATTYELITAVNVGSGGTSAITFSSIPSTFTDLCLQLSVRCGRATTSTALGLYLNGDSSGNNTMKLLLGNGSTTDNLSYTNRADAVAGYMDAANATANVFANINIYIPNYTSSSAKNMFYDFAMEDNATAATRGIGINKWNVTSAITSLSFFDIGGGTNMSQYSTAYLYGIKNS